MSRRATHASWDHKRERSRELREAATRISLATTPIQYLQLSNPKANRILKVKYQSSW